MHRIIWFDAKDFICYNCFGGVGAMLKKIVLTVVLITVIAGTAAVFMNIDKIELIYTGFFMSSEKLHEKTQQSKEKLQETLKNQYGIENIEELMAVSEDEIASGSMSVDELRKRAQERKTLREKQLKDKITKEENCRIAVEDAINEIYVLKAEYVSVLSEIEGEIKGYYNSLMRQEGMTKSKAKLSVANNYTETMLVFQKKCDDAVNNILSKLETVLNENDGDLEIISQIRQEYQNIKNEKMNYYMSRYNKK